MALIMAKLSRRLSRFASVVALSAAALGAGAPAMADINIGKSIDEAHYKYMMNIVPVYFPAVPFGWSVGIQDNVVTYVNQSGKGPMKNTAIKMRYTRKTASMDAAKYMDYYVHNHSCADKEMQGKGFYTTSCINTNTFTIVIGEVNNMYVIELTGEYNSAARAIIENYVGSIVRGKRVFADRGIGELQVFGDNATPVQIPKDKEEKKAGGH